MGKTRRYCVLDVFTNVPLAGNPLAVVLDAEGLDTDLMLRIAGEFNLSETVFILPPKETQNLAAVRIFTRAVELPFAGHPTVGAAFLLGLESGRGTDGVEFLLEEQVGGVRCDMRLTAPNAGHARFTLPRLPSNGGPVADNVAIAAALGLDEADIGCDRHAPSQFSAGTAFAFVPVRDLTAVARIQPRPERWRDAFGDSSHAAAFVYTRGGCGAHASFHGRMFAPNAGIREDPATGAAAAAFAGVVHRFDRPRDGTHRYLIEQGFEMGRPSKIAVTVTVTDGAIADATVGGSVVLVASGEIYV